MYKCTDLVSNYVSLIMGRIRDQNLLENGKMQVLN